MELRYKNKRQTLPIIFCRIGLRVNLAASILYLSVSMHTDHVQETPQF